MLIVALSSEAKINTWFLQDYGVSISFYRAPYLVDIDLVQGKRILMLNDISGNANAWTGADVLFFNTGHWWTHKGALQGFVLRVCSIDSTLKHVFMYGMNHYAGGITWEMQGRSTSTWID